MTARRIALLVAFVMLGALSWWCWPTATPSLVEPSPRAPPVPPTVAAGLGMSQSAPTAIDAGAAIFVRVVNAADQRPLPGASVVVQHQGRFRHHPPPPVGKGITDAAGLVHFSELPDGELEVRVRLPYFKVAFQPFVANGTIALAPLPPARGFVLNADRTPAPGALISTQDSPALQTIAGSGGRFVLALATEGFVVGEKNGALGVGVLVDAMNPDSEVEVVLGAGPRRSARVVGRDGAGLEGVEVVLRSGAVVQRQLTGGDGAWAWPLLEDFYATVSFTRRGYVPVEVSGSLGRPWKDTVLSRGARLEGRLINPDRTPVEGATMEIAGMSPLLRPEPVITDAQGRFSFEGLGFPEVVLWATLDDRVIRNDFALPDGQKTEVTVVLPPLLSPVFLEVVNEDGSSVDFWEAVATPVPDQGWVSRKEVGAELPLCKGRFRIEVTSEDGRRGEVTVEVDPKPDLAVRVTIPGKPPPEEAEEPEEERVVHEVKVRVRTAAGVPVQGAEVGCLAGRAVTERDGTATCSAYTIEQDWPLHVVATLGEAKGMTRATGKEPVVEVVLRQPRTVRGRVLGQLPPSGLIVEYHSATQQGEVELKGNSFAIEGLDEVRTFVCVIRRADPESRGDKLGCAVAEGPDELVITVGASGVVELKVLDETGKPLEAPLLYVDRRRQDFVNAPGGEVRLELPSGTHVLVINIEGRRPRYETFVTVKPGEVTRLGTLRLQ